MVGNAEKPILVTGFEPFGEQTINASWEAVKLLSDTICGHPVEKRRIPVTFGESGDEVSALIDELKPACVIAVGEAGGRTSLTVERVAVNVMDASMADNAGYAPNDEPAVVGGPDAYLTRLPLRACVEAAKAAGVPTAISNTAGLYVCNQLMYRILHALVIGNSDSPAGFVHVPYIPSQTLAKPQLASMTAEMAALGIEKIIEVAVC